MPIGRRGRGGHAGKVFRSAVAVLGTSIRQAETHGTHMRAQRNRRFLSLGISTSSSRPRPATTRPAADVLEDRTLPAVTLLIDYSLDNGFFNTVAKRAAIESVANEIGARLEDSLSGLSSASRTIRDPKTGSNIAQTFSVAANAVRVFVAGSARPGNVLATTFSSTGMLRGNTATDYEPFAISIGFDNDGTTWSFDGTPDPSLGELDFRAVARHELLHGLGINSISNSWTGLISNGAFTGTKTREANRGTNPSASGGHFAEGENTVMQPSYSDVRTLTPLDWAALDDIGWTVSPLDDTIAQVTHTLSYAVGLTSQRSIATPTDVDLHRVLMQAKSFLILETKESGSDTVDTYLRVFDVNGNQLASNDDGGTGTFSKLTFIAPTSGVYYVGISSYNNTAYNPNTTAGRTNGRTDNPTGNYRLSWSLGHGDDLGGSADTAVVTGLSGGSGSYTKTSTVDSGFDADVFRISANAGATLSARTFFPSGGYFQGDTYLRLFDSSGRELLARDGGGGGDYAALQYTFTQTGTYYVGVSDRSNRSYEIVGGISIDDNGSALGDYRLDLTLGSGASGNDIANVVSYASAYPDLIGRTQGGTWWITENANGLVRSVAAGQWNEAAGWRDVAAADVTGDGLTDVVGRTSGGQWYVGVNTNGTFVNRLFGAWTEAAGWRDVRFADFTGDGKTDVAGRTSNGQWWLARSSGASFVTSAWGGWNESAGWRDVQAADFDGDGKADLAARTAGGHWFVARSTGSAFSTTLWVAWNEAAGWRDVRSADFDADGRSDLAGRTSNGQWWVARSTGASFVTSLWAGWNEAAGWRSVMVGDFGGDSRPDLIARTSGGQWWVAVNTGTAFTTARFGAWSEGAGWRDVMAADFAGNGKADVLARDSTGRWWVGQSSGTALAFRSFGTWSASAGWRPALAATRLFPDHMDGGGFGQRNPTEWATVSYGGTATVAAIEGYGSVSSSFGPSIPAGASDERAFGSSDPTYAFGTPSPRLKVLPPSSDEKADDEEMDGDALGQDATLPGVSRLAALYDGAFGGEELLGSLLTA